MNRHALRVLAVVVAALIIALVAMEAGERNGGSTGGELLPGMKERINDIDNVTVTYPGGGEVATIRRQDGGWVLEERNAYAADVAALRKLLLAMADATILEQKTSDPERYERLGVQDPEAEGSEGIRVVASGSGYSAGLIIGNSAGPNSRYARRDGEAASWLVNADPAPPATLAAWLQRELFDVDANRVRSAEIAHADGETVRIAKESQDDAGFAVLDIPAGRELSYPTVANSIGGALNDLQLEDVRPAEGGEAVFTTTFETFDGLTVVARGYEVEDGYWMSFEASAPAPPAPDEDEGADSGEDEQPEASTAARPADPDSDAAHINERVADWQFRIPDYKADQFSRRWSDLLKSDD